MSVYIVKRTTRGGEERWFVRWQNGRYGGQHHLGSFTDHADAVARRSSALDDLANGREPVARQGIVRRLPVGRPGTTYLYFARSRSGGPVKIGISNDPAGRIAGINMQCPFPDVEVLGYIESSRDDERTLHRILASYRTHGEWFAWNDQVAGVVDRVLADGHVRGVVIRSVQPRQSDGNRTDV